jgi:membrane associated rhomboid family serine protease
MTNPIKKYLQNAPLTVALLVLLTAYFIVDYAAAVVSGAARFGLGSLLQCESPLTGWCELSLQAVKDGQVWRFLTFSLTHPSLPGLLANAAALFFVGGIAERSLGKARFAFVWLGSVAFVGAMLIFTALFAEELAAIGIQGCSCGIYGLMGILFVQSVRERGWLKRRMGLAARILLLMYILGSFAMGAFTVVAHAFGFVFGAVLGYVWPAKD